MYFILFMEMKIWQHGFEVLMSNDEQFEFHFAISFASEQRDFAEAIANELRAAGVSVFYDKFFTAELWGQDLAVGFNDIFENKSRYCIALVSDAYVKKGWTDHERSSALGKQIKNRGDYILPIKIDNASLPGLPSTIAYINAKDYSAQEIAKMALKKIGSINVNTPEKNTSLKPEDVVALKAVRYCFNSVPKVGGNFSHQQLEDLYNRTKLYSEKLQVFPVEFAPPSVELFQDKVEFNCKNSYFDGKTICFKDGSIYMYLSYDHQTGIKTFDVREFIIFLIRYALFADAFYSNAGLNSGFRVGVEVIGADEAVISYDFNSCEPVLVFPVNFQISPGVTVSSYKDLMRPVKTSAMDFTKNMALLINEILYYFRGTISKEIYPPSGRSIPLKYSSKAIVETVMSALK